MIGLELVVEYIPTYWLVGVSKLGKYSWRLANFMNAAEGTQSGEEEINERGTNHVNQNAVPTYRPEHEP